MKSSTPAAIAAALLTLLAGCSTASPDKAAARAPWQNGPETALQNGMTAMTVRGIMGAPDEIKPMKAPTGKAEIWVYHRAVHGPVQQVQTGTRSTDVSSMQGSAMAAMPGTVDEPIYQQQTVIYEVTVNLLMFDDTLIRQDRSMRERMVYH